MTFTSPARSLFWFFGFVFLLFKRLGGRKEKNLVLVRTKRLERTFYTGAAQVCAHRAAVRAGPSVPEKESTFPRCPDRRLRGVPGHEELGTAGSFGNRAIRNT